MQVHISPIPDDVIQQMISEGSVFRAAGALIIEHPLTLPFIDHIDGTADGVMGIDKDVALRVMAEALEA